MDRVARISEVIAASPVSFDEAIKVYTSTARGVANPRLHGQAITSTEMPVIIATGKGVPEAR